MSSQSQTINTSSSSQATSDPPNPNPKADKNDETSKKHTNILSSIWAKVTGKDEVKDTGSYAETSRHGLVNADDYYGVVNGKNCK
jgi:hypothetical protein